MRGTSLVQLLTKYRSESRMSRNVAHNAADRDRQVEHIQTVQEWLWEDFGIRWFGGGAEIINRAISLVY